MDLLTWAKGNGTKVGAVNIDTDPDSGYLLRAAADILPGSNIISCSYKSMLSYLNVALGSIHSGEPFPKQFVHELSPDDPNIIGHFFLIQQYLLGEMSFWWPYIKHLPQPGQPEKLSIPIWWPEADQEFLKGTNAEPPIQQRKKLWKLEWQQGIELLRNNFDGWEKYTYTLYQWSVTIFGSRSFRASLTIPEEEVRRSQLSQDEQSEILDHIRNDRFSVLLPLLDLGNHNGVNEVKWSTDSASGVFTLSNNNFIPQGSEVYNYYGNKSNSELLVAYGFILPGSGYDTVNLKVTPDEEALELRRSQICHPLLDENQPEKEFMYHVRMSFQPEASSKMKELQHFAHGLVDTMTCMMANKKEKKFISAHLDQCLENHASLEGPMTRNLVEVLYILRAKLAQEIDRIQEPGVYLRNPVNKNQKLALQYRNRQLQVLQSAYSSLSIKLDPLFSTSSFCQHPRHAVSNRPPPHPSSVEILSLECAFDWLRLHYPLILDLISEFIAEDQEEALPLNWQVLVEDWDHTYWVVWIFTVWMIREQDKQTFSLHHPMLDALFENQFSDTTLAVFHADESERDTIDRTIDHISRLPAFRAVRDSWPDQVQFGWEELRNFASFMAHEECIPASFMMCSGNSVQQRVLCIYNY